VGQRSPNARTRARRCRGFRARRASRRCACYSVPAREVLAVPRAAHETIAFVLQRIVPDAPYPELKRIHPNKWTIGGSNVTQAMLCLDRQRIARCLCLQQGQVSRGCSSGRSARPYARFAYCLQGMTVSCAATICQCPLRLNHVSVQTWQRLASVPFAAFSIRLSDP